MSVPVLGELREQPPHRRVTTFMEFHSACGVGGLARVKEQRLEILAVHSDQPGSGQFRTFIDECKKAYASIRFWALMNPELEKILARYGFNAGNDMDDYGGICDVMDWEAPR